MSPTLSSISNRLIDDVVLPTKLQLYAVIPVHVGRFQDGLGLSFLVPDIHSLEIPRERLDCSGQTLRGGIPVPLLLQPVP